jgi:hypothetical protein
MAAALANRDWQVLRLISESSGQRPEVYLDDIRKATTVPFPELQDSLVRLEGSGLIRVDVDPELFFPTILLTDNGKSAVSRIDLIEIAEKVRADVLLHLRRGFIEPPPTDEMVIRQVHFLLQVLGYRALRDQAAERALGRPGAPIAVDPDLVVVGRAVHRVTMKRTLREVEQDVASLAERKVGIVFVLYDCEGSVSDEALGSMKALPPGVALAVVRH